MSLHTAVWILTLEGTVVGVYDAVAVEVGFPMERREAGDDLQSRNSERTHVADVQRRCFDQLAGLQRVDCFPLVGLCDCYSVRGVYRPLWWQCGRWSSSRKSVRTRHETVIPDLRYVRLSF